MRNRELTRLFLRRFIENDLLSPDADRVQVLAHAGAMIITGALFVSILLSLPYLNSPYPMPSRTAANVVRVQFLYAAWSMTVMALLAVSVWDGLALDSRDTEILGPLPVARGVIVRAKICAVIVFVAAFAAALNVVPAMIHPVAALSRLQPTIVQVVTLIAAHLTSTTAAAAFGFVAVLGLREFVHAAIGSSAFQRLSVIIRAALVVLLVTTLLLVPTMSFRVATLWLQGDITTELLPPMWFAGVHDIMSGHVWGQLSRPDLPPSVALSERAFESLYQSRRPLLHHLAFLGGGTFLSMLVASAAAYLWNNRRLPQPPISRRSRRRYLSTRLDGIAQSLVARRPLVRAGFFFTIRVLARSVQNRVSVGIALAIAIAVATVSLTSVLTSSSGDLSRAPVRLLAIQLLFVAALVAGFRQSVRVPADLRARWVFHLIQPASHSVYVSGVKRAAVIKLVVPVVVGLLPLHALALGRETAMLHCAFGLLTALVLNEAFLLGYRGLPFASSYVPADKVTTYGGIYAASFVATVYLVAWLEHVALSTVTGRIVLFVVAAVIFAIMRGTDIWQRRASCDIELDELVDPPTLRLGLME